MFSNKLARRRRIQRFAIVVAATVLVCGIAVIALIAVHGFDMLYGMEAGPVPVVVAALVAIAALLILTLFAYAAVRAYGNITSR
jgi:ABC-type polysaccharide/polyol phosphate export permease